MVRVYVLTSWWLLIPLQVENLAGVEVLGMGRVFPPLFCDFREESFAVLSTRQILRLMLQRRRWVFYSIINTQLINK